MRINFTTERLSIEPMTNNHIDFMFEMLNTDGWIKNIGNRNIKTNDDAVAYIEKINANPNYSYLVFSLKENKLPIGLVTLIKRDYLDDYDIGFAVLPKYQKKGYSYEASKKYVELITDAGICSKIVAITLPENIGSIQLIEKLGLVYDSEIEEDGEILSVYQKSLNEVNKEIQIQAAKEKIWDVLTNADYAKILGNELDQNTFLKSDWNLGSKVYFIQEPSKIIATGTITDFKLYSKVYTTYEDINYFNCFELLEKNNDVILKTSSGPYKNDIKEQNIVWQKWLEKVKQLAENGL